MTEIQEPVEVLAEGRQFALYAEDAGKVFVLRSNEDAAACRFEGDEAATLLAEYESVRAQYPTYDADQLLAQLWDQGGYSWMAIPDAEESE